MDADWTPGPWFALSWWEKAGRWIRYQPAYKLRALYRWGRYVVMWHVRYKHYPEHPEAAPDRMEPGDPERGVYVHPRIMWEITVAQDARQLERYYSWRPAASE